MQEEEEDGGLLPTGGSHLSVAYRFINLGWTLVGLRDGLTAGLRPGNSITYFFCFFSFYFPVFCFHF
jgi:hypothetical protein